MIFLTEKWVLSLKESENAFGDAESESENAFGDATQTLFTKRWTQ